MTSSMASTLNLTNLPPEIRNMIYSLLLRLERPVSIYSLPRKRSPSKPQSARPIGSEEDRPCVKDPYFSCLLRVNKQVHLEASKIFYSENVFVLGNGSYGSTTQTNIHGMMTFIKRIPAEFLASIKNIKVFIHVRSAWLPFPPNSNKFCVGSKNDTDALQSISRALVKHFTGLRSLEYKISDQGPPFSYDPTGNLFTKTALKEPEAQLQLSKMIGMLSKHENLQRIEFERGPWLDMQKVVDHFKQKNPDLSLVSKVVLKTMPQHS